jgi:hypothetical protein
MVLPMGRGNLEVANLLVDHRDAFDHLVQCLTIAKEVVSVNVLDLQLHSDDRSQTDEAVACLTRAEWSGEVLRLDFRGAIPNLIDAVLVIADLTFPIDITRRDLASVLITLPVEAEKLLTRPGPLLIRWVHEEGALESNPVFVSNRPVLDAMLQVDDRNDLLRRAGSLALEGDEELERFFREVLDVLVPDLQSAWQLAGGATTAEVPNANLSYRIDYDDIDFEMLRRHPKLQQSRSRSGSQGHELRTGLQAILSAITARFNRPVRPHAVGSPSSSDGLTEVEGEPEEREQPTHARRSDRQRRRRVLTNFLGRFLSGLRDGDYQRLVGSEVITTNATILVHILLRLLRREDWLEPETVVDAFIDAGTILWKPDEGYFWKLAAEEWEMAARWLREHHGDAELLGAILCGGRVAHLRRWDERELAIRDLARALLSRPMLEFDQEVLEETWIVVSDLIPDGTPSPTQIVEELERLLEFETRSGLLRRMEREYGFATGSCEFAQDTVGTQSGYDSRKVDCFRINAASPVLELDVAMSIVDAWSRFESLTICRVHQPRTGRVLVYDSKHGECVYKADRVTAVPPFKRRSQKWDPTLRRLQAAARAADEAVAGFQLVG